MSQSPLSETPGDKPVASKSYIEGWGAVYELVRQGKSWSGRERNNCFLNTGGPRFADISAVAGVHYPDDGRALAVVDWDLDGALDFWVVNRTGPRVRFLHNLDSEQNHFLAVRLEGRNSNRDAIGSRVEVRLRGQSDRRRVRTLQAGDGYIAQSSKWIHFGLEAATEVETLIVTWPDGTREEIPDLEADRRYHVVQGSGRAEPWEPSRAAPQLAATEPEPLKPTRGARTFLASRIPLYDMSYLDDAGEAVPVFREGRRPLLITLWASWCENCREELTEFSANARELRDLRVLALSVDEPEDRTLAREYLDSLEWSFDSGYAEEDLLDIFGLIQQAMLETPPGLVLPTGYLVDPAGRLAAVYRGPVKLENLVADARFAASPADPKRDLEVAVAFPGRWAGPPPVADLEKLGVILRSRGHTELATKYLHGLQLSEFAPGWVKARRSESLEDLGRALAGQGKHEEAVETFRKALRVDSNQSSIHSELGHSLMALGRIEAAADQYTAAVRLTPEDGAAQFNLGLVLATMGQTQEASRHLKDAIRLSPQEHEAHRMALYNMAVVHGTRSEFLEARGYLDRVLALQPDYFDARRYLGVVQHGSGDITGAIAAYESALELQPREPMTIYLLGRALVDAGQREAALQQQRVLVELGEPSADELLRAIEGMGR